MASREYPKVWHRIERKVRGATLSFDIKDIPEAFWSAAVEFMPGKYIREDVWWSNAGTAKDTEAIQEYRVLLTSIIKLKMSLGCFLTDADGSGHTLVAVNMCMPQKKGSFVEHRPPKSAAGLVSLRMFAEAMNVTAVYDRYEVDEYLMGTGLSVTPEYRGLGIAVQLLKTRLRRCQKLVGGTTKVVSLEFSSTFRVELAQSLGFRATAGVFTGYTSQRSAEKAGMECLYSTSYKEFGKQCDIVFNTDTELLKIYGKCC